MSSRSKATLPAPVFCRFSAASSRVLGHDDDDEEEEDEEEDDEEEEEEDEEGGGGGGGAAAEGCGRGRDLRAAG